jgi:Flp pilus assembly protein TadB
MKKRRRLWLFLSGLGAVLIGAVLAILFRRSPITAIRREARGMRRVSLAEKTAAEKGADAALKEVESIHADALRKLSNRQKERAEKLRGDPASLARFLNRLSD